jgi:wyosine [tRNA(Phe)-imidazoG37] synthetase (radical SAM superfamily)
METDLKHLHLEMGKAVYGPVLSRRFGLSLGVNLLPSGTKTCSLDCVYCQLGRTDNPVSDPSRMKTYPSRGDIVAAVERKVKREDLKIDVITFSGNGEPTLHPELQDVVREIRKTLDERRRDIPINILTNSTQLCFPSVRACLKLFDNVIAKLDTADQDCFMALNRPVKAMNVREVVKQLKQLRKEIGDKLTLQTMIVDSPLDGVVANYGENKLAKLVDAFQEIDPSRIQIYTLDRKPAEPYIVQVNRAKLDHVAQAIALKLNEDRIRVYYDQKG